MALVVKNPSANAGDIRHVSLILRVGRSPGEGMATHSSVLSWEIPWTEEPGKLQSIGSLSWTQLKQLSMHTCTYLYMKRVQTSGKVTNRLIK